MDDPGAQATEEREYRAHALPDPDDARRWLREMLLIRRFEERAGEMYAKAKIGGFLHLCIGEEATVVGAVRAMRDGDYLISTYREHGHALARGTEPERVMAELFGREGGVSRGRGGSMHLFDAERRFMGGYGIVGANLPLAAGMGLTCDYMGTDEAVVCMFGDGAINQGNFGETMNLAALWSLPVVFVVVNNQFGMGTAIERHSAVTDLERRGEGFGVPGTSCDGMDILDVHATISDALRRAREERKPMLVEAVTYRFRGHSMADPEEYRSKEQVQEWRGRDPIDAFGGRLVEEGVLSDEDREKLDSEAVQRIDEAVAWADDSPLPTPESLYDNVYVLGNQVQGWYSVDERGPGARRGEDIRGMDAKETADMQRFEETSEQVSGSAGESEEEAKPADAAQRDDD